MLEFFKSLFKPQGSGATARERLRLVLLSDHLSLAPDMIDALKADLLQVFSRYFEYDAKQAEVTFDHRESEVAMLASVPIQRVRERTAPPPAPPAAPVEDEVAPVAVAVALLEPESPPEDAASARPQAAAATPRPRRRRRKRNGASANGTLPTPPPLSTGHSAQA